MPPSKSRARRSGDRLVPLLIAHILFWILLLIGASDIGRRACAVYVALWLIGYVGSSWLLTGGLVFVSYVAILDIALVLHVFQGDVHLR